MLVGRRLWIGVQEFRDLASRELQLRQENGTSRFGRFGSGCECFHGVPGVVDVEDRIVVVLEIISVDGDVSGADEAGTTVSEL